MLDNLALIRNAVIERRKELFWMAPFLLLVLWTLDTIVSFFVTGFAGWTWAFTAAFLMRIIIIGLNIHFIKNVFLLNSKKAYMQLKTYTGYFIVFVYVFYNLPRMTMATDGLINHRQEITLWISSLISSLWPLALYIVLWLKKTREAWDVYKDKKTQKEERKKNKGKRSWKEILWENTDAVISSIITVIIIQHFIFQLYVIPTESMVPTFLVGDRTFVTKYTSGPSIPLTEWRLPRLRNPKKGDIVVYQSPEYTYASVAKRVFQQFVRYITLTLVDIDRDENGNIRKRFIVKRLVGTPGEKFMMVDDVLYVKRIGDADFKVDQIDKKYANIDLYALSDAEKEHVLDNRKNYNIRAGLLHWDNIKNSATIEQLESGIQALYSTLMEETGNLSFNQRRTFFEGLAAAIPGGQSPSTVLTAEHEKLQQTGTRFFQQPSAYGNDIYFFYELLNGNTAEIDAMVRSALDSSDSLDIFESSSRKLNLMFKTILLQRFIIYTRLVAAMTPFEDFNSDEDLLSNISTNKAMQEYLMYFDYRNFPAFPEGEDNFIPENHYFLLGDNRYNSLDFRYDHGAEFVRYLDKTDEGSIAYMSRLDPYLLESKNILGYAKATFWPFSRAKWHTR